MKERPKVEDFDLSGAEKVEEMAFKFTRDKVTVWVCRDGEVLGPMSFLAVEGQTATDILRKYTGSVMLLSPDQTTLEPQAYISLTEASEIVHDGDYPREVKERFPLKGRYDYGLLLGSIIVSGLIAVHGEQSTGRVAEIELMDDEDDVTSVVVADGELFMSADDLYVSLAMEYSIDEMIDIFKTRTFRYGVTSQRRVYGEARRIIGEDHVVYNLMMKELQSAGVQWRS